MINAFLLIAGRCCSFFGTRFLISSTFDRTRAGPRRHLERAHCHTQADSGTWAGSDMLASTVFADNIRAANRHKQRAVRGHGGGRCAYGRSM